jgi:tetratricopeptide (TPR) repeat protein
VHNPDDATLYSNRAAAKMMQGTDYQSALNDCLESISKDQNFVKSFLRASKCYVALGKLEDAEKILGTFEDNAILQQRNLIRRIKGDLEKAQTQFENEQFGASKMTALMVLERAEDCMPAKVILIDSLIGLGEFDEARKLAK